MNNLAIYTDLLGRMPVMVPEGERLDIESHPCYVVYRNGLPVTVVPHEGQILVYNYVRQMFEELLEVITDDSDSNFPVRYVGTRPRCEEFLRANATIYSALRSRISGRSVSWML